MENINQEIMRALQRVDQYLEEHADEFRDIPNDPERTFKYEYQHEGLTEKFSSYKRRDGDG